MGKILTIIAVSIVLVVILLRLGGSADSGNSSAEAVASSLATTVPESVAPQATTQQQTQTQATPQVQNETLSRILETDEILGDSNAPITLVEFGDYQCTFCNVFFNDSLPTIKQNYIDTGKVNMVFRDFPVNGHESSKAARAAYCAGEQGQFWPFHDVLFNNRTGYNNGQFSDDALRGYAQDFGLDVETFGSCYDSDRAKDEIEADEDDARRLGVRGTPNFFIVTSDGGVAHIPGAQPLSWWTQTFDEILAARNIN